MYCTYMHIKRYGFTIPCLYYSLPLRYVEHGGRRWLCESTSIDGPQTTEYPKQRALTTAVGACD